MFGPECLQATIRADPLIALVRLLRPGPRDRPHQATEGALVVERLGKFHPRGVENEVQVCHVASPGPLGAGQQHWDDVKAIATRLLIATHLLVATYAHVDGDLDLLLLPRPQAAGPQEHDAGLAVV